MIVAARPASGRDNGCGVNAAARRLFGPELCCLAKDGEAQPAPTRTPAAVNVPARWVFSIFPERVTPFGGGKISGLRGLRAGDAAGHSGRSWCHNRPVA
jgi:hypothetical protein